MDLLVCNFNPGTVEGLMCRNTVSIAHDGSLYDCDFNQQLLMGAGSYAPPDGNGLYAPRGGTLTVHDIDSLDELLTTEARRSRELCPISANANRVNDIPGVQIVVDSHCFGCTAGKGSSCQGAVVE